MNNQTDIELSIILCVYNEFERLPSALPELLEDNDDFILNQHSIPSSNKYTLRKRNIQSKTDILNENFNLHK